MSGAAYNWSSSCTDDETYARMFILKKANGDPLGVNDYAFEYSAQGCGSLLLDESNGITKDAFASSITISPGVDYRFARGTYQIGLRMREIASGVVTQIADGTLTVTEGNFNG